MIGQIQTLIGTLKEDYFTTENLQTSQAPQFQMTIYGTTVNIIDFSMYESVRPMVHKIIIAVAWSMWGLRFFRRLPAYIGGFGG